jgi:predicted lactoylglutathione lyase
VRMIFVNLPVKDLKASMGFFTELGFEFNPEFSDEQAACMVVDENIFVMLLVEDRFKDFINGEIADAPHATEAITAISADSKESVDETVSKGHRRRRRALEAADGGRPDVRRKLPGLGRHVWELIYMAPQ